MVSVSAKRLAHLRRESGLTGRRRAADFARAGDRRGLGVYVLPPNDYRPPRDYDADGNEVRRVAYDK